MMLLGYERIVTQDFFTHGKRAEDYSGEHLSEIKFNGVGKVIKVINRFKCHEDTINENDFINYKNKWKDGEYYNCVSITRKNVRIHTSEQGGNMIVIESYYNNTLFHFIIKHLADVYVKVGDIINPNTIIGTQGNTGIVLSSKSRTNSSYGTHIHFEVKYPNGEYINPRDYALGKKITTYISPSNEKDNTKNQFKVMATAINIRENHDTNTKSLGLVYTNEIYTILDYYKTNEYDWYKIKTNTNITGWVANNTQEKWLELFMIEEEQKKQVPEQIINTEKADEYKLIFECDRDDIYAIKLKKNEKIYIK